MAREEKAAREALRFGRLVGQGFPLVGQGTGKGFGALGQQLQESARLG